MRAHLSDFLNKPLISLTEDRIKQLHQEISLSSPAQADLTMRFLRALFNFAKYEYRGLNNTLLFEHNPVAILSHQHLWNHVPRKNTRLTRAQLPDWFKGIDSIRDKGSFFAISVCDLVEMAILTGLRRSELISLKWDHVDLRENTYYLSTTKNGEPLELPLTQHMRRIFERRKAIDDGSPYVFSAPNAHGQIKEPKKIISQIETAAGINFTLHDLRRTFTTTAESLNVGTYTIKRLLNHKTRRDDVTAGYTVLTPEELRKPAQSIEDEILRLAGREPTTLAGIDATLESLVSGLSDKEKRALIFALSEQEQNKGV
jgi:integrase